MRITRRQLRILIRESMDMDSYLKNLGQAKDRSFAAGVQKTISDYQPKHTFQLKSDHDHQPESRQSKRALTLHKTDRLPVIGKDQEHVIEIENALKDLFSMRDDIVEAIHNLGPPQSSVFDVDRQHTFIPPSEIQRSQRLDNLKRKLRSVNLEIHAKVLELYELTNRRVYRGYRTHPVLDRLDYRHYYVLNPNSMSDDDLYVPKRRRLYEEAFNVPFMQ